MASLDILYLILGVAIVVITVTVIWFANEAIQLIRSLRRSTDDVATVTKEFKSKVLLMSEALDRVGTAASRIIGLIEDAEAEVRTKREKLSDGIGLIVGVADYSKKKKGEPAETKAKEESEPEPAKPDKTPPEKPKEPSAAEAPASKATEDKPESKSEGKSEKEEKKEEKKEESNKAEEKDKPVKEEVGAMPSAPDDKK